jgi:hypothetical protein
VFEWWRQWTYRRYEARYSSSEDFAKFEQFASGPWTPEMAARAPWDILMKGPQLGGIDPQTRKVIDLEVERRLRSSQPLISNIIATLALIFSAFALFSRH